MGILATQRDIMVPFINLAGAFLKLFYYTGFAPNTYAISFKNKNKDRFKPG